METRTSRNPFKKLVSLVLVMTMVMAMGITSFAATSDPNMTNDYSQCTLQVAPGAEVTLYASPAAKDTYAATGFDTDATTADVAWTSTNTDIAVVEENSIGFKTVDANDGVSSLTGLYCAKATVKVPATATIGSCSIEARNTKTNAYVNFTIVVDTTVTQDADNVNVYLVDYMDTLAAGLQLLHLTRSSFRILRLMYGWMVPWKQQKHSIQKHFLVYINNKYLKQVV